jgi:hypothetical protein
MEEVCERLTAIREGAPQDVDLADVPTDPVKRAFPELGAEVSSTGGATRATVAIAVLAGVLLAVGASVAFRSDADQTEGLEPNAAVASEPRGEPAAPTVARMELESEPAGARVVRVDDGEVLGVTPFSLEAAPGSPALQVRFELADYAPLDARVPVKDGTVLRVGLTKVAAIEAPPTRPPPRGRAAPKARPAGGSKPAGEAPTTPEKKPKPPITKSPPKTPKPETDVDLGGVIDPFAE